MFLHPHFGGSSVSFRRWKQLPLGRCNLIQSSFAVIGATITLILWKSVNQGVRRGLQTLCAAPRQLLRAHYDWTTCRQHMQSPISFDLFTRAVEKNGRRCYRKRWRKNWWKTCASEITKIRNLHPPVVVLYSWGRKIIWNHPSPVLR